MNKDNLLPLQDFSLKAIKESNVYFLSHAEDFAIVGIPLETVVFLLIGIEAVLYLIYFDNKRAVVEKDVR